MRPQEFIQTKKLAILEIRENSPEILSWVMANYLKRFDKSLTNTKSRVNIVEEKIRHVNISPNEIINTHAHDGSSSSSDSTNYDLEMQQAKPRVQNRTGEILSDFADRLSQTICKANEKIQSGYDSEFSTAEEDDNCDCYGSEDLNDSVSREKKHVTIIATEEKKEEKQTKEVTKEE